MVILIDVFSVYTHPAFPCHDVLGPTLSHKISNSLSVMRFSVMSHDGRGAFSIPDANREFK